MEGCQAKGLGVYTYTVDAAVADGSSNTASASCTGTFTVVDNVPPVLSMGCAADDVIAVPTDGCSIPVPNYEAVSASDNCDPNPTFTSGPTQAPPAGDIKTPGTYGISITAAVADASGNAASGSCSSTLEVIDTTPPYTDGLDTKYTYVDEDTGETVTKQPAVLWPPNHEWATVSVVGLRDNCEDVTGPPQCKFTDVDIYDSGPGDGGPTHDPDASRVNWDLAPVSAGPDYSIDISLRKERAGNGIGRVYELSLTCADAAMNWAAGSWTTEAVVPESKSPKAAVDADIIIGCYTAGCEDWDATGFATAVQQLTGGEVQVLFWEALGSQGSASPNNSNGGNAGKGKGKGRHLLHHVELSEPAVGSAAVDFRRFLAHGEDGIHVKIQVQGLPHAHRAEQVKDTIHEAVESGVLSQALQEAGLNATELQLPHEPEVTSTIINIHLDLPAQEAAAPTLPAAEASSSDSTVLILAVVAAVAVTVAVGAGCLVMYRRRGVQISEVPPMTGVPAAEAAMAGGFQTIVVRPASMDDGLPKAV